MKNLFFVFSQNRPFLSIYTYLSSPSLFSTLSLLHAQKRNEKLSFRSLRSLTTPAASPINALFTAWRGHNESKVRLQKTPRRRQEHTVLWAEVLEEVFDETPRKSSNPPLRCSLRTQPASLSAHEMTLDERTTGRRRARSRSATGSRPRRPPSLPVSFYGVFFTVADRRRRRTAMKKGKTKNTKSSLPSFYLERLRGLTNQFIRPDQTPSPPPRPAPPPRRSGSRSPHHSKG